MLQSRSPLAVVLYRGPPLECTNRPDGIILLLLLLINNYSHYCYTTISITAALLVVSRGEPKVSAPFFFAVLEIPEK